VECELSTRFTSVRPLMIDRSKVYPLDMSMFCLRSKGHVLWSLSWHSTADADNHLTSASASSSPPCHAHATIVAMAPGRMMTIFQRRFELTSYLRPVEMADDGAGASQVALS